MLHMQHLVKQDIFHGELRHARPVHAAVQQNMIWPGIVAAELPTPASIAPANMPALQLAVKISGVEFLEPFFQTRMASPLTPPPPPHPLPPHPIAPLPPP